MGVEFVLYNEKKLWKWVVVMDAQHYVLATTTAYIKTFKMINFKRN